MTLRERIADWLTGGTLTAQRATIDGLEGNLKLAETLSEANSRAMRQIGDTSATSFVKIAAYEEALGKIIMAQTPSANATVKRMAKVAYDALYPNGEPR